jgi:DNA invertase Pin-like site-specific DNA recombinase
MSLALLAQPSVHGRVARYLIYVRRSYKEATAADVSDAAQEAACRALLPAGATAEVITDSGGHRSGATTKRDGYQELLVRLRSGAIDGIAVYDLSRLHRNTENMLALARELERRSVPLLIALMPTARFDGANGRFMLSTLAGAAQLQRDLDSERMKNLQRRLFEDGRHRGHDPLGYHSLHDASARLVHPRQLVIDPEEAAIVRRVFHELAQRSLNEVADLMNQEGVPHDGLWTRDGVKDVCRRGRLYLGFVVEKRGRDERPGQHEPILTEAEYRATVAAIAARTRVGNKPKPFRHYVLRGLATCSCGTRMRGEAHLQRGTEIRYYRCPTLGCRARRCPADVVEGAVLAAIARAVLPSSVIDAARAELRRRLEVPQVAVSGRQRARLQTRLEQLKKQHSWGDISDGEYQAERDAVRVALQDLPDDDRIRSFDAHRTRLLELPNAIEAASPARREELARIVVQQVIVRDRQVQCITWTPAARPFFEKRQRACPQGVSSTRPLSNDDVLEWYVA